MSIRAEVVSLIAAVQSATNGSWAHTDGRPVTSEERALILSATAAELEAAVNYTDLVAAHEKERSAARTEELNDACRALVAMIRTPALLRTDAGEKLIEELREHFEGHDDERYATDVLIGTAVLRASYLGDPFIGPLRDPDLNHPWR